MQKFSFLKVFGTGFIIAAVMLASSCASHPAEYEGQAFDAVGPDADVYIYAPVAGNESLLKALFSRFVPDKTADQYLSRTSILYAGVQYSQEASVTVVSTGAYPTGLSDFLFSQKDGWQKQRAAALHNTAYYTSATADIVLQSKTAFALLGNRNRNTEDFLQRIAEPHPPVFPPQFQTLIETGGTSTIGIYIPSGSLAAGAFFNLPDIDLPIQSVELYLKKQNNESVYHMSAACEVSNARLALVLRVLLGAAFKGNFSVQGSFVFIENADITEAVLLRLLQGIIK